MKQQALPFGVLPQAMELYIELLAIIEEDSSGPGKAKVAEAIGMRAPTFSNALRNRNDTTFKAVHFVALLLMDKSDRMLEAIARSKGKTLHPVRPLTDAEKLERLQAYVRKRLGDLGEEICDEALEP